MRLLPVLLAVTLPAFATPKLESLSSIPSSTLDSLGDTAGSFGSGSSYDPKAGILYLTTDRGPGDGAVDFSPRLYSIPLPTDEKNIASAIPSHLSAHLYKDPDGKPFTGLIPNSSDPEPRMKDGRRCLDPEGLTLMLDGNLLLCEEYMPSILQFKPDGTFMARLIPPKTIFPVTPPLPKSISVKLPPVKKDAKITAALKVSPSPPTEKLSTLSSSPLSPKTGAKTPGPLASSSSTPFQEPPNPNTPSVLPTPPRSPKMAKS